jgi:hypothetical protein
MPNSAAASRYTFTRFLIPKDVACVEAESAEAVFADAIELAVSVACATRLFEPEEIAFPL